eukprot:840174_1
MRGDYKLPGFLTDDARDLISKILNTDPKCRISIMGVRKHPWYTKVQCLTDPLMAKGKPMGFSIRPSRDNLDEEIVRQMTMMNAVRETVIDSVINLKHDHHYALYHFLELRKLTGGRLAAMPFNPHVSGSMTERGTIAHMR